MNNRQVRKFFIGKETVSCPLTNELIASGYKQKWGGYIKYAKECNVDNPTQYWHLITSWSERSSEEARFTKRIQCGELIFWMAEVSNAVEYDKLVELKNVLVDECINKRRLGNKKVKELCFDEIVKVVEEYDKNNNQF